MKVHFLQRLLAYIVDVFIIGFVGTLLTFFIPVSEKYQEAMDASKDLAESYVNKEISNEEYIEKYGEYNYILEKETVLITVVNLIITVAYFGTYNYYNHGQTLGKKLMKIRIEGIDGKEVSHVTYLLRTALIYGVFFSILSLMFLCFIQKDQYLYTVGFINLLSSIFVWVSIFMILFRKDGRGLHDLLCKTRVVSVS